MGKVNWNAVGRRESQVSAFSLSGVMAVLISDQGFCATLGA